MSSCRSQTLVQQDHFSSLSGSGQESSSGHAVHKYLRAWPCPWTCPPEFCGAHGIDQAIKVTAQTVPGASAPQANLAPHLSLELLLCTSLMQLPDSAGAPTIQGQQLHLHFMPAQGHLPRPSSIRITEDQTQTSWQSHAWLRQNPTSTALLSRRAEMFVHVVVHTGCRWQLQCGRALPQPAAGLWRTEAARPVVPPLAASLHRGWPQALRPPCCMSVSEPLRNLA